MSPEMKAILYVSSWINQKVEDHQSTTPGMLKQLADDIQVILLVEPQLQSKAERAEAQ